MSEKNITKSFVLFGEFVKMGATNLFNQKVRTLLTSGAITIGVVLILIMVSLGIGVNDWLIAQITGQMDITTVVVLTRQTTSNAMVSSFLGSEDKETTENNIKEDPKLTTQTIEQFNEIPGVIEVIPLTIISADSAIIEGYEHTLFAPSVSAMPFRDNDPYVQETIAGNYMDLNDKPNTAVLTNMGLRSTKIEEADYPTLIGKKLTLTIPTKVAPTGFLSTTIESKDVDFIIVGLIDVGIDNNQIMINIDKATELLAEATEQTPTEYLDNTGYMSVMVRTESPETTEEVSNTIEELGFTTSTTEDIIKTINEFLRVVQVALSLFGIIALVVATLGIANTMIMSIYERTRDIGILKAVGASKGNIRGLFLIESALIGVIGGIFGLIIGYTFTPLINLGLVMILTNLNITVESPLFSLPIWLSGATLGFSIIVAILAGIYPSNRAANLDPIKAIKYE